MRMLHISFVLICSLLFSRAGASDLTVSAKLKGCGSTYDCYVPSKCTEQGQTIETSEIDRVRETKAISDDCEAILRFHLYASHSAFVSLESMNAATTSIELFDYVSAIQTNNGKKVTFSCKMLEVSGKWELQGYYGPHTNRINNDPVISDTKPEKLKCEFKVQIAKKEKIFLETNKYKLKIDDKVTLSTQILPLGKCDPATFIDGHNKDKKNNMVYKKVNYNLGTFSCGDEIYNMESRLEPSPDFKKIKSAECNLAIQGQIIEKYGTNEKEINPAKFDYEIRCAAEVRFFCKEGVKSKDGKAALNHVPPNLVETPNKPSKLNCPPEAPHFVVREDEKPIQNAKFECLSYEEVQRWTVIGEKNIILDPEEAYYCTKDLECHLQLRIAENSVINGDLDSKTFLPKCSDKGILQARQVGEKNVEIYPPSCNYTSGEFEYKVKSDGRTEVVVESTLFECTYPQEVDVIMPSLSTGSTVGLSVAGVVTAAVGCGGLICLLLYLAAKKQRTAAAKQKQREADEMKYGAQVWKKYCMDKEEREALASTKKKGAKQEKTPKAGDEVYNWNRMLMSFQTKGAECTGVNKDGVLPRKSRKDQNYRFKSDPGKIDPEPFAKYEVMQTGGIREEAWRTPEYKALDELTHSMVLVEDEETKKMVEQLLDEIKNETICEQNKRDDTADYKKNMKDEQSYAYAPPRDSRY